MHDDDAQSEHKPRNSGTAGRTQAFLLGSVLLSFMRSPMRIAVTASLLLLLVGCATRTVTPREYLDEQTAATITVVADPWIFTREQSNSATGERDFLNLYAIDVNRMGEHRQYLAVLQSLPDSPGANPSTPTLELHAAGHTISLQPLTEDPQKLGIAQPLAPSYTLTSKWWYFPMDKDALAAVARAQDLQVALIVDDERIPYLVWRDGSAELSELTAVLP